MTFSDVDTTDLSFAPFRLYGVPDGWKKTIKITQLQSCTDGNVSAGDVQARFFNEAQFMYKCITTEKLCIRINQNTIWVNERSGYISIPY